MSLCPEMLYFWAVVVQPVAVWHNGRVLEPAMDSALIATPLKSQRNQWLD